MIEIDINGLCPVVKKRGQIDSVRGLDQSGATPALVDNRFIKDPSTPGIVRIVVDPAPLIRRFEFLCRDHRLPKENWPEAVFTGQQAYQTHIGQIDCNDLAGE